MSSASIDKDPHQLVVKIEQDVTPNDVELGLAGEALRSFVVEQTGRGVDVEGTPFAPYSKRYARQREKKGRKRSPVDLLMSGRMLQALTVVTRPGEFSLGIFNRDEAVRAKAHNEGLGKMPKRHWLGANEENVSKIARLIEKLIGRRLGATSK